jgi:predicted extracellular nuclease
MKIPASLSLASRARSAISSLNKVRTALTASLKPSSRTVWLASLMGLGLIGLLVLFCVLPAARISADTGTGSISLTTQGSPSTENFDSLANTGTTNTTLPTGWYLTEQGGGARDNEQYGADSGGSNTGDIYSYGTTSATERAFGALRSGTLIPFIGAKFTNNTGGTITSLDVSYTGEEWRLGTAARTDRMDFQYSLNATDLTTGTYTDVDQLDFTTPNTTTTGAKDGNAAGNRTSISFTIPGLSIANGASFFIRWTDFDASGADDGLAVDDFSLTPQGSGGGGQPSLSINDVTVTEGNAGTTTASFTVSLTAPALAGGVTFDIATQDNSATTLDNDYVGRTLTMQTITQGNQSYTFDVTVNGDTNVEPNETFFVNVTNITGAAAGDTQGVGTISNDDFAATPIHTIQGSGNTSPFNGNVVTTTGIVTGVKTNGFFIQAPDAQADADPNTSEGIFVFTSSAPSATAAVGNSVAVMGTVQEFIPSADPNSPPATEIAGSPTVTLLSTGNALPTPITLTTADTGTGGVNSGSIDNLEKYEGMRVHVNSLTTIAPTQGTVNEPSAMSTSNGVFYGVIGGVARPFREPGIEVPDPLPAGSPCCVPRFDANPERLRVDSDGLVGAAQLEVTSGATIANVTGPLDYAFRTYTILPDPGTLTQASVVGNVSATPVPVPLANEFTVGSFNMERFFDTVADGNGAPTLTLTAFNNRLNKASLAIRNVMREPDILGIEEMENITTLQAVANKVNMDAGTPNDYQAYLVEGNDIGGIDVGFLVRSSRVTVIDVTQFGKDTTYINPNNGQPELLNDRPPLVLRATISGFPITVIVNHLRSLSGVDDPTDGNRVRTKRRAQAEYLANLIQSRQATEQIVSVGDYNVFEFNDGYVDSMGTIKGTPTPANQVVLASSDLVNPDLTDLIDFVMPATQKYSYSFDGNAQTLDHEVITQNLLSRFSHVNYARNDADFPESFRNDPNRPERISDHDMAVAYFTFPHVCNITCPQNKTQSNDTDQCGAFVSYPSPTVSNSCFHVGCSPASDSFFPVGTTTVTCAESIDGGPSCSFSVTVNDTQPPGITCPANVVKSTDPNQCSAVVAYQAPTVSDNCRGAAAPKDKGATVPPLTPVCTPASGSTFTKGVTTVTCTVSDVAGNQSSCSFTVTVNDTQPPAITCPANITKPTDPNQCSAVVSFAPTVSDNCPSVTPACSPASGFAFPKGTTTVTCTVSDSSGNQASCLFTVTVSDTQPPVFANGCPANVYTAAAAACPIATSKQISYTYPVATDNCSGVTVVCNPPTGSTFPAGTTTVTCTATDSSGNTASCSFQVSVFSACLVDDSNPGNVVLFNASTGDYRYCCNGVVVASGRGTLTVRGCSLTIDEAKGDHRVRITADTTANSGAGSGTAFFQRLGGQSCQITDRSMAGNTCTCN